MKLLVIGGTGKTGRELIKQGLENGHIVTALVRNPAKLKLSHPNLKVKKGNVLIPESFGDIFQGQDAVLSALGHKRFFMKPIFFPRGQKILLMRWRKKA